MKLRGRATAWLLLVAGGTAAALGCERDSEPCEKTQTCIQATGGVGAVGGSAGSDGGSDAGSDGEGGSAPNGGSSGQAGNSGRGGSGASSGNGGESSGTGGTGGGGDGGGGDGGGGETGGSETGGSGGSDDDPPTVESFTPDDGSLDVERDIVITITLSEPIDESTVTATSVTFEGPDGSVSGRLSADEAVISFTPDKPLYLLGSYTITLADTVADRAGNRLAEGASAEFSVRDGRWGAMTTPFGTTVARSVEPCTQNSRGDLVIAGSTVDADEAVWAAVYDVTENEWTAAETLQSFAGLDLAAGGIAIDDERRASLSWRYRLYIGGGWFRFTDDSGWVDAGAQPWASVVAVTNEGQAVSVWSYTPDLVGQTQDIVTGSVDPPMRIGPTVYQIALASSLDRVALFTMTSPSFTDLILNVTFYDRAHGWGESDPLATSPTLDQIQATGDELGNFIVLWSTGFEIWSRIYDRAQNDWGDALYVTSVAPTAFVGRLRMSQGVAFVTIRSSADPERVVSAEYLPGIGWIQNSIRTFIGGALTNAGPAIALDRRGNALVAWDAGFNFRRYVPGVGWSALKSYPSALTPHCGATAPDGTVTVVGVHSTGTVESVPAVIRFE
jgi:hypothetical protein